MYTGVLLTKEAKIYYAIPVLQVNDTSGLEPMAIGLQPEYPRCFSLTASLPLHWISLICKHHMSSASFQSSCSSDSMTHRKHISSSILPTSITPHSSQVPTPQPVVKIETTYFHHTSLCPMLNQLYHCACTTRSWLAHCWITTRCESQNWQAAGFCVFGTLHFIKFCEHSWLCSLECFRTSKTDKLCTVIILP